MSYGTKDHKEWDPTEATLDTHTHTVKEMLRLFNKRRFLCVECLGLVTTFNEYHSSFVYLRYKLSKPYLRNINVGWRRLAWEQKNTLHIDMRSRFV